MSVQMEPSAEPIAPLVKEVLVPLGPERAFELFTARIAEWWPLRTHSVAGELAALCAFEPHVGGRLYERAADGTESTWGTVLEWRPPTHLAVTWHPGRTPATEQQLRVSFVARGSGTVVRLVHTGWERLGAIGSTERDDYDTGWDYVLGFFTRAVGAA